MEKILLNDQWELTYLDSDQEFNIENILSVKKKIEWMETEVPGDVHSTLLKYKKIEDPFYSTNAEKCRWVESKTWIYKTQFNYDRKFDKNEIVEIKFNGIDTFGTVYLNNKKLGTHENMFTPASFDISDKIKPGLNNLIVKIDSTIEVTSKKDYSKMWFSYSPNRAWVRKAQMNFRWDWGPRIITSGLWKNVELNIYKSAKIESVFFRTTSIKKNDAKIEIGIETRHYKKYCKLNAKIDLLCKEYHFSEKVKITGDKGIIRLKIKNPKIWWTHDLGIPELYDLKIVLEDEDNMLDTYQSKVGIRTISVKQSDERKNKSFIFVLNNLEIFSKGANWIPAHNFIGTLKDETYVEWIDIAKKCNMNMLRVWGGGIYEKDIFYRECDRQGILVWQDFMFACSCYPDFDKSFMDNVKNEIIYVVKKLRNHPSIAIWCGNNEIQWIHGQKLSDLKDLRLYGEKIYHDLMPEIVPSLDPTRLYWPSSPFGGNDPNSDDEGDKHNWQVWAGQIYPRKYGEKIVTDNTPYGISFKRYAGDFGKFISEFGMHALPVRETLETCIPEKELYFGSFEMRYRNKDKRPNRGKLLMESYTGLPSNLEEYIDFSMLAQAAGLKFGIEHYRRRKPECAGAIIWQLNDCWPAMSWSIVDFYMRPKAGYYYTKKVFNPVLLSFKEESADILSLWVTNDSLEEYSDILELGLKDFFGNAEYSEIINAKVKPNTSEKVKEISKNRINVTYTNFEFLYVIPQNEKVDSNIYFFEDYKDLNLPGCNLKVIKKQVTVNNMEIEISTDNFAKFVKISGFLDGFKLSDNYFDLMPGERKIITVTSSMEKFPKENNIEVIAINSNL